MHFKTNKIQPFRIVADSITYSHIGTSLFHFKYSSKYVREYKNPGAEELYKQAQQTKDIYEKASLYEQMGHYELKSLSFKERFNDYINGFLTKFFFR